LRLQDYWKLEPHTLGETSFTHYADGTAHKNRMQGNDFVQSVMYRRGVTCASCHDAHGTENDAQLRKPAATICLDCHAPKGPNGPHVTRLEDHTRHKIDSPGSQCVPCHMPKIAQTIADVNVRSHTFRFITPSESERLKVPNACIGCHKDKTNAWASEQLKSWPEISPWRVGP
jgi:predicted CXXCH cytochrome family protein